ncbi:hypothetical protein CRE_15396 [Caenorhabditis remanei]|uniref:Piwi domain-containing protein n=1 Tax=Caenorhabditis remanei TaxID=31234 RepID=E3MC51_CAERE|nr:hypothetical protein CRE_15396 [Caenorhabditis remanei]
MPSKANKKKAADERRSANSVAGAAQIPAVNPPEDIAPEPTSSSSSNSESSSSSSPYSSVESTYPFTSDSELPGSSTSDATFDSLITDDDTNSFLYPPPAKLEHLQDFNPIEIVTNSYLMKVEPVKCYCYNVSISVKRNGMDSFELSGLTGDVRQRQRDLSEILRIACRNGEKMEKIVKVYDGATKLYTTKKLKIFQLDSINATLDQSEVPEMIRSRYFHPQNNGSFLLSVTLADVLISTDVLEETSLSICSPVTQMLRLALQEEATTIGFLISDDGNKMFDRTHIENSYGMDLVNGFGAQFKIAKGIKRKGEAHLILTYEQEQLYASGPLSNLPVNWKDLSAARSYLKGLHVQHIYSQQFFTISDVSDVPLMTIDNGKVLEKAMEQANRPGTYFNRTWPAIQVNLLNKSKGRQRSLYFPIETLKVLPDQKLPEENITAVVIDTSTRFSETRKIEEKTLLLSPNPTLSSFGMTINPEPITVEGFAVSPPTIMYNGYETILDFSRNASWLPPNNHKGTLIAPARMEKVLLLYNSSENTNKRKVDGVKTYLIKSSKQIGIIISSIDEEDLASSIVTPVEAIEQKMNSLQKLSVKPIVIYATENDNRAVYKNLKLQERLSEVVTQYISFNKFPATRPFNSNSRNILKLNVKCGGFNHRLVADESISHLWGDSSNTLIISYDVRFPDFKKSGIYEVLCTVGFGYNGTRIPEAVIGDFHYQLANNEQVDSDVLTYRAKFMLNHYLSSRKKFPDHVIIIRDEISQDQHDMVRFEEFPAIQKGIMEIFDEKKKEAPSFALLVINKRHSHQLHTTNKQGKLFFDFCFVNFITGYMYISGISNVPPLTAIDRRVVSKEGNEIIFASTTDPKINKNMRVLLITILLNENVFKTNNELTQLMAAMCCANQVFTRVVQLPETIIAAESYAKRGADLFDAYYLKCRQEDEPLPEGLDGTGGKHLDLTKLTELLSYESSCFSTTRIV